MKKWILILLLPSALSIPAIAATLSCDLNHDAKCNVADIQCSVEYVFTYLNSQNPAQFPPCGKGEPMAADVNCDAKIDVSDTALLTAIALGNPIAPELDVDGDGEIDACQQAGKTTEPVEPKTCSADTCLDFSPYCAISGPANSEAFCPIHLARKSKTDPLPTTLQWVMRFDAAVLAIDNFYADDVCVDDTFCMDTAPTTGFGAFPLQSGHAVAVTPLSMPQWNQGEDPGFGEVVIAHAEDQAAPLSEAHLDADGNVTGESRVLKAKFILRKDMTEPVTVALADVVASDADGNILPVTITQNGEGFILLTGNADDTDAPLVEQSTDTTTDGTASPPAAPSTSPFSAGGGCSLNPRR